MRPSPRAGGPPRILHIVADLDVGGIALGVAKLIEHSGHAFAYAVACIGRSGPVAARLAAQGVPIHFLGKGDGHEWTLFLRIAALCRSLRPDIVHTHNWSTFDAVPGARLARVPAVIHVEHTWEVGSDRRNVRRRRARRLLMPFVTRWVVVCESVRRSLVRDLGLRADAIGLVPNGVDTAVFAPPADRRQHRMQRGYTDADIVIGTVGRAVPVKNWPVLLQAFARVRRRHPGAHLVLVGDGPDKAASEAVVRALDIGTAVRFVGHSNDVPAWLACMDVFALPSSTEAASNALLEAMAVGLPAVATDAGGTPELVDAGVTGQLVPPTDVAALAETLAAYCEDGPLRLAHGAAGRRRVEQRFSMHAMASGYTDVYRRALRARSVSRSESSSASVSANGKG